MTEPTDAELLAEWGRVSHIADAGQRRLACLRAVLAKWGTPPAVAGDRTVSHKAQAIPGVQWQCGPQASGFTAPQADSQPAVQQRDATRAAARALSDRFAEMCNVDKEDHWQYHSDDVLSDAELVVSTYLAARAPADSVTAPAGEGVAGSGGKCMGQRCMASTENGYAHSRECIDEAGEVQGWKPTAEDYATCGPSAPAQPAPADSVTAPAGGEIDRLRAALVYVAFALHGKPQYMLAEGIALIDGDTVRVSRDGWTVEASVNPARATPAARAADSVLEDAGGSNWQDISTAPKDGTRFVAVGQNYGLDSETQHTCIAQWFRGCWIEVSDWNGASELKYLTHWMPLPPLPGSAASAPADSVLEDAARYRWLREKPGTDSVLEDAARWTTEQEHAIRQGHEIAASDGYFEARPQIDSNDRRKVFQAGFERGWDAARKQGANHD